MNTNEKISEEFRKKYKELEEENNKLKFEFTKLEESVNELKNLEEENKKLKEENNRLKLEIIKLTVIQNMDNIFKEKIENKQINEISDSKLEGNDKSISFSFNPNKTEKSLTSNLIDDYVNSISFVDKESSISFIEPFIEKLKNFSFLDIHFICKKCNKVPRIEFVDLKMLNYTCSCHKDKNLGIDIIKDKSITEFENDNGDITKYLKCQIHHKKYHYYCKYCNINLCRECLSKQAKHISHIIYLFDFHTFEANENIYNIYLILNSKKLNIEKIEYGIIDKILFLFSVIVKDFIYYPNYSHFKIFENALTFFKIFFSNAENNKIIESLGIEKKLIVTYKNSLFQNISNVHSIIEINIKRNNFNDISELCKLDLINLEKLILCENCISDIKPLINANFKNIKFIDLELNKIGDDNIPHLSKLKYENLNEFNLYLNNFTDPSIFEFINEKNLPNLKVLFLGNNKIDWNLQKNKINNNYHFNNLKTIGLSCGLFDKTSISYLKNFNFENLEILFISRNNIGSLSFVETLELPNIKDLYINNLDIEEFYPLVKYKTLEKIYLRENYIRNIDKLELFIKELPKLILIDLERNDIDIKEEKNKKIIDSILKNKNGRCINILI